jgi:hypothetical protein
LSNDHINGRSLPAAFEMAVLTDRGRDVVYAGSGDDFINAAQNADRVRGGAGNDWIRGGKAGDVMGGNSGATTWSVHMVTTSFAADPARIVSSTDRQLPEGRAFTRVRDVLETSQARILGARSPRLTVL